MLYKWFALCVFVSLLSCDEPTATEQVVYIWSDQTGSDGKEAILHIEGNEAGTLHSYSTAPNCQDSLLISYTLPIKDTVRISIIEEGEQVNVVDLYLPTVSSGISIKLYGGSNVDIDGLSQDECTLMYIKW